MPRAKTTTIRLRQSAERIRTFVEENFNGYRHAAESMGLDHATLWRAAKGHSARGVSADVAATLADHSDRSINYWLGRDE